MQSMGAVSLKEVLNSLQNSSYQIKASLEALSKRDFVRDLKETQPCQLPVNGFFSLMASFAIFGNVV